MYMHWHVPLISIQDRTLTALNAVATPQRLEPAATLHDFLLLLRKARRRGSSTH
jgi:hypothetical protein